MGKVVDMTVGRASSHIIKFAMPLILGSFFQLTYNAADSIIVGRFVGTNALAAVGAAAPIMNIVLFIIVGLCLGMSVLMGEFFGEGDMPKLKREISTSFISGGIFTIVIVILGILFSHEILKLMNTPEEIIDDSTRFLQIIFGGFIFTFIYNIYASTLRSMGNSNASLYFLITSAVLNVIMDIIFVVYLKAGVAGAAWATFIAEALSAIMCIVYVKTQVPVLHFTRKEFVFDHTLLRRTVNYSSVAAMQQICLYVGKLLIQGAVNPLGIHAIAAFNAVNKIDDFVLTPEQNIAHAATGYIAQNNGAGKKSNIRKGFRVGIKMEIVYSIILMATIYIFAYGLTSIFVGDEGKKVILSGAEYLQTMAFYYFMPGLTNILQGYFRGMGKLKYTLNSTFLQIGGRVVAAYILAPHFGLQGIAFACLVGWIVMLAYEVPLFAHAWKKALRN
jgi:putative MATE family efflux protein